MRLKLFRDLDCPDDYVVKDLDGNVVAYLTRTAWGKWKIVGEDVYSLYPDVLVERLEKRR